ncbi:hypothetical protein LCGC14_2896590, partial [marine sediment metagenome]
MIILSIFLFLTLLFILSNEIIRNRPMPLSGAISVGFAGLIGLEAILLNILSLFRAVTSKYIFIIHIVIICSWAVWVFFKKDKRVKKCLIIYYRIFRMLIFRRSFQLLVPLWIIIGITAWIYPPNNYDSLTYHMPRVAHWIQNQSIEYYPTPIDRQNVMGPGAEYLILFFQLLTGSDRLATLVQFFSFMLLIISTYYVIRIIKLPQKWLPYIMIIATTAPIAIMEASNTKNDLVAALITLSIIISGARFFSGNILKTQLFDFVIIGMCLGVGFLVKPTALIVALPVLIIGIVAQVKKFKTVQLFWKRSVLGFLFSLLAATAVAGPDLYRKVVYAAPRYE